MEPIPYFLLLLKKNVLLCSIIMSGSLTQVDLTQVNHVVYSNKAIELLDFTLGENENFSSVMVLTGDEDITITFHTAKPDYFNHPEQYFQRTAITRTHQPFGVFGAVNQTQDINLGDFYFLPPPIPPASVYLTKMNTHKYDISVVFYKFNTHIPALYQH